MTAAANACQVELALLPSVLICRMFCSPMGNVPACSITMYRCMVLHDLPADALQS